MIFSSTVAGTAATPFVMDVFPELFAEMALWVTLGPIHYGEEFVDGFEKLPATLFTLFDGT